MRIVFVINGVKKNAQRIAGELVSACGFSHQTLSLFTSFSGHAAELVQEHAAHCDLVVAVGGDGTMHECVTGLMKFQHQNRNAVLPAITLIPNGTGNDFARNFQFSTQLGDLSDRLGRMKFYPLDVVSISNRKDQQWFINVADVGLGAEVVERILKLPSKWPGKLKFRVGSLIGFMRTKKQSMTLVADQFTWSGKALMVAICNGKYFGSGIGIAPTASPGDGVLDVTIIGKVSWLTYLRYLPQLTRAKQIIHPEVHYFRAKKMEISETMKLETDGELCSMELPLVIECLPGALKLLV